MKTHFLYLALTALCATQALSQAPADKPTPPPAGKAQNRRVEVKLSRATDDEGSDTAGRTSDETPSVEFKDSVRTAREHGSR